MCVCVFADCREATEDGLKHLGSLYNAWEMYLFGLPDVALTDAFLESLHGCSQLGKLQIGGWRRQIKGNITAGAVTRSVSLHIHTGNSISPPVGRHTQTHSHHGSYRHLCRHYRHSYRCSYRHWSRHMTPVWYG